MLTLLSRLCWVSHVTAQLVGTKHGRRIEEKTTTEEQKLGGDLQPKTTPENEVFLQLSRRVAYLRLSGVQSRLDASSHVHAEASSFAGVTGTLVAMHYWNRLPGKQAPPGRCGSGRFNVRKATVAKIDTLYPPEQHAVKFPPLPSLAE